jgi:hypothetical protein
MCAIAPRSYAARVSGRSSALASSTMFAIARSADEPRGVEQA